jgi:hypothetical protein
MKHWKAEGRDAKDFRLVGNVHAATQPQLSASPLTLTLYLQKGEANWAAPLQSMVSPDLVRWQTSWPQSENRT